MTLWKQSLAAVGSLALLSVLIPAPAWSQNAFTYKKIVTPSWPGAPSPHTPGADQFRHPTTMAMSADGRLFFAQRDGRIYWVRLNSAYDVVGSVQRIDTIFNLGPLTQGRVVTGMAFAPNGDLFVSHSDGRLNDYAVDPDSGTITRLLAPSFTTSQLILTGLPRSHRDHGPNGLLFKNGKLYIAQAGMTNAGRKYVPPPNVFDEWFDLEETELSAAILEIDPEAPGPPVVFAKGLRNPYELLVHSNGKWYTNDNSSNPGVGFTTDPVTCGQSSIVPSFQDELHFIEQGGYYGHPNPMRGGAECLYLAPNNPAAPAVHQYGQHVAANGIAEYTSWRVAGLQGDIITARLAGGAGGGGSVVKVKLSQMGLAPSDRQS